MHRQSVADAFEHALVRRESKVIVTRKIDELAAVDAHGRALGAVARVERPQASVAAALGERVGEAGVETRDHRRRGPSILGRVTTGGIASVHALTVAGRRLADALVVC